MENVSKDSMDHFGKICLFVEGMGAVLKVREVQGLCCDAP